MADEIIKNLDELIQRSVGPTKKIIKSSTKRLTAPGENYLGLVLKVKAVVKNEKGEEENFIAVAKCVNPQLTGMVKMTIPNQFRKERGFYTDIVPTLEEFQQEVGLEEKGITDVFPKLYTSRFSLDETSEVPDENSVMLIEYLGDKGYANTDRLIGFDLEGAKLILTDLAAFHAITIALKLKKPEVFETKVKKYLYKLIDLSSVEKREPDPEQLNMKEKMGKVWLKIVESDDEAKVYMGKLIEKLSKIEGPMIEIFQSEAKEPFASISHVDLWTNNTMQVFKDGKPIKNKILDFQTYHYASPVQDLMFFLGSSVQLPTLHEHLDDLIKFYHENFINLLDKCGCDISPFSYQNFLKEIDENAKTEFTHILFMQMPIYGKKNESMENKMNKESDQWENNFSEQAKKRIAFVVSVFGKRGWI